MAATESIHIATFLEERIRARTARVGILGLGYVGLPLAVEFANAGFNVTGFDTDASKRAKLEGGESYVRDVPSGEVRRALSAGKFRTTSTFEAASELDVISICVPTPLRKTKDPDMSFVVAAVDALRPYLHPAMLIVLESTTYPGTTEEVLVPRLNVDGLEVGRDIFVCFSPERVDPGNPNFHTANIPKVIGGVTENCRRLGALYYGQIVERVVPVSSPRVAEMVKLLENTFRMINIGLANEMALMCHRMGINVWEVIEAAATKPFGFMPFYPGPGLGGHCIPVDPFYLSWKTKQSGIEARFIELAGYINGSMPHFVVSRVQDALNDRGLPLKGSRIHVMGVAYKADIDDVRESPALDIIQLLVRAGAFVSYTDPYVPTLSLDGLTLSSEAAEDPHCVIVVTDHSCFEWDSVVRTAPLIVDTRNALKKYASSNVVRL